MEQVVRAQWQLQKQYQQQQQQMQTTQPPPPPLPLPEPEPAPKSGSATAATTPSVPTSADTKVPASLHINTAQPPLITPTASTSGFASGFAAASPSASGSTPAPPAVFQPLDPRLARAVRQRLLKPAAPQSAASAVAATHAIQHLTPRAAADSAPQV
jgi:hypothetical protein